MKSDTDELEGNSTTVAPLAGAWIEILTSSNLVKAFAVAPPVGAWIEIQYVDIGSGECCWSLPLWERGLKWHKLLLKRRRAEVAPLVGSDWIKNLYNNSRKTYSFMLFLINLKIVHLLTKTICLMINNYRHTV